MDYGKKATSRKRNSLISRSSMMGKMAHVSMLRVLFISLIAVIIAVTCLGIGAFRGIIDNAPDVDTIDIMPLGYASYLYDDDGNQIRKLAAPDANRIPVSLEQIPVDLQHAVVAIEDERFYEHNGIDVRGILRAASLVLRDGDFSQGASTITQQLLKNNVFTNWTAESTWAEKFIRKFQEQYLAIQIEQKIGDKGVILENYLNTINLGAGAYGVQAAARTYFNKDVWDLNLSESVTLAGITQNPTGYNPIIYPEKNAKRRKEVLDKMLDQGYITSDQYTEALNDNIYEQIQAAQEAVSNSSDNTVYSYFEDALNEVIINDFITVKGYTRQQAQNMLYSGGIQVYSTWDRDMQKIIDEEYSNEANFPAYVQYALDYALTINMPDGSQVNYSKEMMQLYFQNEDPSFDLLFDSQDEGREYVNRYKADILSGGGEVAAERISFAPQPQSSVSIIDQHTGYVKAMIGGRGEKTASLTLNRATDSTRQPGSTFKPLSTYGPALNEKGMTLATTFEDKETFYPDGSPVRNADLSYSGTVTIRTALMRSINTVAVQCLERVTPELGLEYLDNLGFTTLAHGTAEDTDYLGNVWSDANLSTALGGITYGVTNVELCAAYAAIANGGNYIKPIYYTKILDRNGNVLIDNSPVERSVFSESTAFLLTNAMEDVVKKGTGTSCQLSNMPVAGKTGTTEYYNDLWFVGYTPYYTCAIWSGYDNNEKLPQDQRSYHNLLWKRIMERVHEGMTRKEFDIPSSVQQVSICSTTGLLPISGCPVTTEYFAEGTAPASYCEVHYYQQSYNNNYGYTPSVTSAPETDSLTPVPDETGNTGDAAVPDDGTTTDNTTVPDEGTNPDDITVPDGTYPDDTYPDYTYPDDTFPDYNYSDDSYIPDESAGY